MIWQVVVIVVLVAICVGYLSLHLPAALRQLGKELGG